MKLSPNNQKVLDVLRSKNLRHLVKPFKRMIELDELGKIKVHKMTWKVIMREVHNENISRAELEKIMMSYFVNFHILVEKKVIVDTRSSADRVKKHRQDKKELGYKSIAFLLSPDAYEKLKRRQKSTGKTYSEIFEDLI